MPTPLLVLEDVEARYGPIRALHGVSLEVEDGQAVALLGANGAGKTTTLRAISGTVRTSGEITLQGKRISRRSPELIARLGVAHVPEGRGMPLERVRDNSLTVVAAVDRSGSARIKALRLDGKEVRFR